MKLLFVVQGEGRGHMTQALALQQVLGRAGHEVSRVVLVGSVKRPVPSFFIDNMDAPVTCIDGPAFVPDAAFKSMRRLPTLLHNLQRAPHLLRGVEKLHMAVERTAPDLIINFYDLLTGLYALKRRPDIPIVCIGHQYLFQHPGFSFPSGRTIERRIFQIYTAATGIGAARRLALSFYPLASKKRSKLQVVPPLLRRELFQQPLGRSEDFLLVYLLNAGYSDEVIAWHERHPEVPVHCFRDREDTAAEERYDETLTFHRLDGDKFLRMMAHCSGVATTAGFESVCEAAYLGKPVLLVPVEGHFEQSCNARDARAVGAGIAGTGFNLSPLLRYREMHDASPEPFRAWVEQGPEIITHAIESIVL